MPYVEITRRYERRAAAFLTIDFAALYHAADDQTTAAWS
jgi:hypothetical protein